MDVPLENLFEQFIAGLYGESIDAGTLISASGNLSPQEQLSIYRGSVLGNLSQALGDIFPVVKACVGNDFFNAMSVKYIAENPSRSSSLDDYGEQLPKFIALFPPLKNFPYLEDVALLEWHWHRTFHRRDEVSFDATSLGLVQEQQMDSITFQLPKSLTLLESNYPTVKIWEMNSGLVPEQTIDLAEGREDFVIWRVNLATKVKVLSKLEAALLKAIQKGDSLGTICQHALSYYPNEEVNEALSAAVAEGWIASYCE